ncbi:MAG: ArsA-related P-loop ATPase, partial [Selenomonadaceae bacterium]
MPDITFPLFSVNSLPPVKYLFFTGKGGVGKTSLACSVAVTLADEGKRVL